MSTAIRISDKLISDARTISKIEKRSLTGQIEYWAQIGKIAQQNPDLSYHLIKDMLIGLEELGNGEATEYVFEK